MLTVDPAQRPSVKGLLAHVRALLAGNAAAIGETKPGGAAEHKQGEQKQAVSTGAPAGVATASGATAAAKAASADSTDEEDFFAGRSSVDTAGGGGEGQSALGFASSDSGASGGWTPDPTAWD